MPVTIEKVNLRKQREALWNRFLADLQPWELHRLLNSELEMVMHDDFVDGKCSLRDVRVLLAVDASAIA